MIPSATDHKCARCPSTFVCRSVSIYIFPPLAAVAARHFFFFFFVEAVHRCTQSERRGREFNSAESRITHTGESEKL